MSSYKGPRPQNRFEQSNKSSANHAAEYQLVVQVKSMQISGTYAIRTKTPALKTKTGNQSYYK